jgi:nucleoside-diphosphate-sugar epimerase
MSSGLTETVALITGATSGIGKPTASALAERGAHTLVGGRNAERGEQGRPAAAHQGVGGRVRPERGPGQRRQPPNPPGPTRTEGGTAAVGPAVDQLAALAPAGRPASPDEIAAAIT